MSSGLFEIIQMGGPVMWLIFVGSVLAVGVFLERLIYYHRCSVPIGPFLKGIRMLLRRGDYQEALDQCDAAYGPAIKVVQSAIIKRDLRKNELREVIQEVAQLQIPRMEAHLSILSTVAHVMPLLGLFGTVTGMIEAFMEMTRASGATSLSQLAGGIWEALVTTAGGLGVAIPAYIAHNYLLARVNRLVSDMERAGIEILQMLKDPHSSGAVPTLLDDDVLPPALDQRIVVKQPDASGDASASPQNDPAREPEPKPSSV
ncbi:MAG: MotA/TolQ/ExbB proton channel family protein [Candidatus Methylacidiphilales bacterium]